MNNLTTNQKLFSDIVMFLETSIEHPYLKTRDVGSFDDLADALNVRGYRNNRGQRLTCKGITKFISRMSNEEKCEHYPDCLDTTSYAFRWKETHRKQRLAFTDAELFELRKKDTQ